jgi:hypothetical protein
MAESRTTEPPRESAKLIRNREPAVLLSTADFQLSTELFRLSVSKRPGGSRTFITAKEPADHPMMPLKFELPRDWRALYV